ncbi:MAG: VOC family protein [Bacteroidota bacterium]
MLTETNPFSSFSTDKLLDSYLFYKDLLGLEVELVNDQFIHLNAYGCSPVVIYQKEEHQPAEFTVLNFPVRDIELIVDEFTKKGIVFEQYQAPIKTDEKGISWDDNGSHIAWFKDPGGNILALIEN